jgi:ABC-type Fe3+-siderophore transport system permease subunit
MTTTTSASAVMAVSTIGTATLLALSRTGDRMVSALVLVPAGAVAALLVGFFAWRESLRRQAGRPGSAASAAAGEGGG